VSSLKHVIIHTDGACLGNPGPGGFGAILRYGDKQREMAGGYRLTTNNRMEMWAAITALEALRFPCRVTLYSDSQYLVKGLRLGWARRWRANGWMKQDKSPALNADLWERLLDLCEVHEVTMEWVRGHAGDPDNERCDRLSNAAAQAADLPADPGYCEGPPSRR